MWLQDSSSFQVSSQLLLGSCNQTLMGLSFLICKMGAGGGDTTTYLTHGAEVRKNTDRGAWHGVGKQ